MMRNAGGNATKRVTIATIAATDNVILAIRSVGCKSAGSLAADGIYRSRTNNLSLRGTMNFNYNGQLCTNFGNRPRDKV
jgi:hypothetical protein